MKLSILICSIEKRKNLLDRLLQQLELQKTNQVEILINLDNGEKTVGAKRNELLLKSKGEYVCFIDDDDTISDDYIEQIILSTKNNPDVIGFNLNYFVDGVFKGVAFHSLKYNSWFEKFNKDENIMNYFRNPNHLNPIKSEISKKVMFPNLNHREDYDYSMRIFPLLKTENYISKPLYNYLFIPKK